MVTAKAGLKFGADTRVVADYDCPPGGFCEFGFGAFVILVPPGQPSATDLTIYQVSGPPDTPTSVALYAHQLPAFMQSLLP